MKLIALVSVAMLVAKSLIFGQVKIPQESLYNLSRIESFATEDWKSVIQNKLLDLPIYKVNGEWCLSMVAKVNQNFKETNLNKKAYLGSQIGEIATIKLPLNNINAYENFTNINYLEIAGRIQPMNNRMVNDVRADSIWEGINLNRPYTGKNVLIGVTDWGFDYDHPMFMDTTFSNTRIRAAWDQFKTVGDQPLGFNYGVEYNTPSELDAANSDTASTYYDYATHGSHVAGIAGGSGAGTKYRGVAFESEFLFNSIQLDVGSAIDAWNWMKGIADADDKRLVVNMSWGLYYIGTMDGSSTISTALDALSDQGVVFTTSAGNNGGVNFHVMKDFSDDTLRSRIQFYDYNAHASMWGQSITMWGEIGESFNTQLEVYNVGSSLLDTSIVLMSSNTGYFDSIMKIGTDTIFYNVTIEDAHPLNSRPHMRLRVKNTNTSYRVVLKSFAETGIVHYWNLVELSNGVGNWGQAFYGYGNGGLSGDTHYGIGEPACTESVITVAAHNPENINTNDPGSLAYFSSEGPLYNEVIKPDVSAPGFNIVSSINSYTTASYSSVSSINFNGRDYDFAAFSGTSMSSPATAGVAALMLDANNRLTPEEVKEILKVTAREDNKTGAIVTPGSVEWGMGKVTATEAVLLAQNTVSIDEIGENFLRAYPNPVSEVLNLTLKSVVKEPITYEIYTIQGKQVLSGHISSYETINISNWTVGVYIISVRYKQGIKNLKFIKE